MVFYSRGSGGGGGGTTDLLARQIAARIVAVPGLTPDVPPGGRVFYLGVEYVNPTSASIEIPDPLSVGAMTSAGFVEPSAPTGDRPTRFIESLSSAGAAVAPYSYVHVIARGVDRNIRLDDSAELGARVRVQYMNLGGTVGVTSNEPIMLGAGDDAVTVDPGDVAALDGGASGAAWFTRTLSGWWAEDRPAVAGYDASQLEARIAALESVPPDDDSTLDQRLTALENAAGYDDSAILDRVRALEEAPGYQDDDSALEARVQALENAASGSTTTRRVEDFTLTPAIRDNGYALQHTAREPSATTTVLIARNAGNRTGDYGVEYTVSTTTVTLLAELLEFALDGDVFTIEYNS